MDKLSERARSLLDAAQRRENLAVTASLGAVAATALGVAVYRFATKPHEGALSDFQAAFEKPRHVTTRDGTPVAIERVKPSSGEICAAADTLGRAMRNDPLVRECATEGLDEAGRERAARWVYKTLLRTVVPSSEGHVVLSASSGDHSNVGVAIWAAPGTRVRGSEFLWQGGWQFPCRFSGWDRIVRYPGVGEALETRRHRIMSPRFDDQFYQLILLGVDDAYTKHGVGHALVEPVLAIADREDVPCLVETANPETHHFFTELGFVEVEDTPFFDFNVTTFVRAPHRNGWPVVEVSAEYLAGLASSDGSNV